MAARRHTRAMRRRWRTFAAAAAATVRGSLGLEKTRGSSSSSSSAPPPLPNSDERPLVDTTRMPCGRVCEKNCSMVDDFGGALILTCIDA